MTQPTEDSKLWKLGLLVALGVIFVMIWFNHLAESDLPPVGTYVAATPAEPVKREEKTPQPIQTRTVHAYSNKGKAALKLPAAIADDPLQVVIEATTVKADDHPQTIATSINTETGETTTVVRREPLPWLAWDDHGEVGLYGGIKNGTPTARLEAKQGIFQMKAVHVGVIASADHPVNGPINADYYVGVGAWYRW